MPPDDRILARCVGEVDRFLADTFTRATHLHRGGDFSDLLSLDDVDRILTTTSPRPPTFRLVRDGGPIPPSEYTRSGTVGGRRLTDLPDVGRVLAHFEGGATIVLQGLHRYWEPVTRFCRDLELFLTHPVQANAYLTPPVAAGLDVHHDTHDVFALQTYGTKQWVTYAPVVERPTAAQRWDRTLTEDPGEPTMDVTLEPGDCLYVPRGTLHAARTVDRASLHLTIGIRATTWVDVVELVVEAIREDASLREALPAGYAHRPDSLVPAVAARLKEVAALVEGRDAGALADRLARRFWSSRTASLRGHLHELLDAPTMTDDTEVWLRPGAHAHLTRGGGRVTVHLGDRRLDLPEAFEPIVARLLDGRTRRVGDLGDVLDPESRLTLVRRFVREGALVTRRG